jgi:hypothetical protein
MSDLSNRLTRLTQELRALRLQLQWSTFRRSTPSDQTQVLNHLLDAGMVEDLKELTEQLNHFFWSYIDSAAENKGPDVNFAEQSKQVARVTELLRCLRESTCPDANQLGFVARVTLTVDRHLEAQAKTQDLQLTQSA